MEETCLNQQSVHFFRIGIGLLGLLYFADYWRDCAVFVAQDGLLPHEIILKIFPFTAQPLFSIDQPDWWPPLLIALGALSSALMMINLKPRLSALVAFLIISALYRWSFLVINVEDVFMHLFFFWCALLPAVTEREASSYEASRSEATRCPYTARLFFLFRVNFSLIYLTAGLSKWLSPMWRDGEALHQIVLMQFTRLAEWWPVESNIGFQLLTWIALGSEALIAILPWLRDRAHLRALLIVSHLGLHLFNAIALGFIYSNLGCLAMLTIILSSHGRRFRHVTEAHPAPSLGARSSYTLALIVVSCLVISQIGSLLQSPWREHHLNHHTGREALSIPEQGEHVIARLSTAVLWGLGLAQSYRLMDWIDERNFVVRIWRSDPVRDERHEIKTSELKQPRSLRYFLPYAYLFGVSWHYIPPEDREALEAALTRRLGRYLCDGERVSKLKHEVIELSLHRLVLRDGGVYGPTLKRVRACEGSL